MFRFALISLSLLASSAHAQTLLGYATLPADTFRAGPTSGQKIEAANGRAVPFVGKQPVQGFSSLQAAPNGDLWALSDNGYGSKANSPDFELCITRLGRDFKTARGGRGRLFVKGTIVLSDPLFTIPFPLVNGKTKDRRLTGADFDPESLVVAPDGSFWIGEEFGPMILHFDDKGELLETPRYVEGVASPDDPYERSVTLSRSKGFEGMAWSKNKNFLMAMLEGSLHGDVAGRLRIFQIDPTFEPDIEKFDSKAPDEWIHPRPKRTFYYQLEDPTHSIGELARLPNGKHLVIERDSLQGDAAKFKKIYEVDFDKADKDDYLIKRERADLLNIADPDHLASDGVFRFPFQTIESVLPLDNDRVIVMNDNNYPFSAGRQSDVPEITEAIVIRLKP